MYIIKLTHAVNPSYVVYITEDGNFGDKHEAKVYPYPEVKVMIFMLIEEHRDFFIDAVGLNEISDVYTAVDELCIL